MSKLVVLVCGGAQHGKDVVCSYMRNRTPGAYPYHLCFAETVKDQASYLGWDGEKDFGGRQFLIDMTLPIKKYGNWLAAKYPETYGDYANGNFYTAQLYSKIKESNNRVFFISDFRFKCEYDFFIKKLKEGNIDVVVIRITRVDSDGVYYRGGLTDEQLSSSSETEWKNISPDWEIMNDSTLDELYLKLDIIINKISER